MVVHNPDGGAERNLPPAVLGAERRQRLERIDTGSIARGGTGEGCLVKQANSRVRRHREPACDQGFVQLREGDFYHSASS
jgi:hypothetical protein